MNINGNTYTISFSVGMVVVVAILLALASTGLKKYQDANEDHEKIVNLFKAVGENVSTLSKEDAKKLFDNKFDGFLINDRGIRSGDRDSAFVIQMKKQVRKKDRSKRTLPIFVYDDGKTKKYVLQTRGQGLWDAIWMYLSLKEDFNSIDGAVFGHAAETPGLGAEITESKTFYEQFENNKKLFDTEGNFISIKVLKGTGNDLAASTHYVDGITGATMTCKGVTKMFQTELKDYVNFLKKNQN